MTEEQAGQVGRFILGLERLALELGWRFDGERWVKPAADGSGERIERIEKGGK